MQIHKFRIDMRDASIWHRDEDLARFDQERIIENRSAEEDAHSRQKGEIVMTSSINPVASTEARYLDALIETMEIAPSDGWRALSVDAVIYQRSTSSDVVPVHLISAAEAAVRRYWCV